MILLVTLEHVYIYKTGAYIGSQDVVEVSIVGIAEIPPEKEWVHDVATFDGDIVYINGGYTIDELLLLDYLPDIVDIEHGILFLCTIPKSQLSIYSH